MRIDASPPALAVLALTLTASAAASETSVSPDKQAHVLVRTLAFDRALPARVGKTVGVGVVFGSKKDPLRFQYEVRQAFQRMTGLHVLGRPVDVSIHSYKDVATLASWMREKEIRALYVAPGLSDELEAIRAVCDEQKVDRKSVV